MSSELVVIASTSIHEHELCGPSLRDCPRLVFLISGHYPRSVLSSASLFLLVARRHEYGLAYLDFYEAFKLDPADQGIRQLLKQFRSSREEFEKADLLMLNAARCVLAHIKPTFNRCL